MHRLFSDIRLSLKDHCVSFTTIIGITWCSGCLLILSDMKGGEAEGVDKFN